MLLNQDSHLTDTNLDKLMESSKKTQQDMSNLSVEVLKISSDTAKREESYAKIIKLGASLETGIAESKFTAKCEN